MGTYKCQDERPVWPADLITEFVIIIGIRDIRRNFASTKRPSKLKAAGVARAKKIKKVCRRSWCVSAMHFNRLYRFSECTCHCITVPLIRVNRAVIVYPLSHSNLNTLFKEVRFTLTGFIVGHQRLCIASYTGLIRKVRFCHLRKSIGWPSQPFPHNNEW